MNRRLVLASAAAVVLTGSAPARGNGRPPATTGVHTQPGASTDIYLSSTFGLLISRDDGCSFRWICEGNIGYGGMFDPKYAVTADGTIFATTFNGLRVSRDGGCSFTTATEDAPKADPGRFAGKWVDAIELGPDGELWVATAASGDDNDLYRSTDGGRTFVARGRNSPTMWWKSVKVAPSQPARVYISGYQVSSAADDGGLAPPITQAFRSDDGGDTWSPPLPLDGVALHTTPLVTVEAVDPGNPDRLYLRSSGANPPGGDRLYRSTDGGQAWTEVLVTTDPINRVLLLAGGEVLVATTMSGLYRSADGVAPLAPVPGAPKTACLDQRGDGTLLACGTNWDPDFKALARSADGLTWTKTFRFAELAGPVSCPVGSPQHDMCEAQLWPSLREQFGAAAPACAGGAVDAGAIGPDARGGGGAGGCCDGGGAAGSFAAAGLVAALAGRRRRRR